MVLILLPSPCLTLKGRECLQDVFELAFFRMMVIVLDVLQPSRDRLAYRLNSLGHSASIQLQYGLPVQAFPVYVFRKHTSPVYKIGPSGFGICGSIPVNRRGASPNLLPPSSERQDRAPTGG